MADAWFGSMTVVLVLAVKSKESFVGVKTNSGLFPKKFLNETLEEVPGGVHLVLKGTTIFFCNKSTINKITCFCYYLSFGQCDGVKLFTIGYRHNSKKAVLFVGTESGESTRQDTLYEVIILIA